MPLISANGVQLFYDITGPGDGTPILFSNSLGTTIEMWDAVVRRVAPYYKCIRYDTRGHGRSEVKGDSARLQDLAADAAGLLDALNIPRAHVAGLSIGGMTAQAMALAHPEKVMTLTLMATTAYLPPASAWEERAELVLKSGTGQLAEVTMGRWFTPGFRESHPEEVNRVLSRFLAIPGEGYAACCRAIRDMDLRDGLAALRVPTLIIAGEQDPSTPPAMSEDLKARMAGSELQLLSPAAHLLAVEQPAAVAELLLSFLTKHSGRAERASGGASFHEGLANRKSVLGVDHVERSLQNAGAFASPWQDFITRNAWGEVWGDPALPWKTRSLITLAMTVALNREEEFKLHLRPALHNGVTPDELRALLMQTAIYAGVPAANNAFKWVREALGPDFG
jgi:3-oxoadipate enol-lactonase/4-carboxymuconolactone decarboxylase